MKLLLIATSFTFLLAGCSTTINKSQHSGSVNVNINSHLKADVDVDMSRQVKGTANHKRLLWIFPIKSTDRFVDGVTYNGGETGFSLFSGGIVEETKSAAAYNAVVPNKVEVLIAPQYIVQVKSYFFGAWKEVTASVSGYAGKIRDFKSSNKK